MDKIQAAIAKARAARDGKPSVREPVADRPVAAGAVQTAWDQLRPCAPDARRMAENRVVTFDGVTGEPNAIAMDILRTKVLQKMRANGWQRLAITSPGADCGKSTVTLNLAFSMARQAEQRVIVAEMDMRRPSLATTLGVKGDTSFAAVLEGQADFADAAVRPRPNVAFGLNHTRARNSAELLQSPTIAPALAEIEARYDPSLMIFDMPPLLVTDDTMAFIGQVDCVLLIAAAGSTSLREIDTCERDLAAQTNVLGVVLNKCRHTEEDHGYGYG